MKCKVKVELGGKFFIKHYRDGNRINADGNIIGEDEEEDSLNKFIDEGLINGLNVAFAVGVGSRPSALSNLYIGLTTVNRAWAAGDIADTIHTVGGEFETFDEAARPAWSPQALAASGNIQLSNAGAEATFTVATGGGDTVYGAFIIDNADETGASDTALSILVAGSNFTSARVLLAGDVFKVGYVLSASSST